MPKLTRTAFVHYILWKLKLLPAETQTTASERDALARYAENRESLAEIGVWHGVTTCRLRQAMSASGTIFAIDPYPIGRLGFSTQQVIAHQEVKKFDKGRIEWLRETGVEAANRLKKNGRQVEFLFIDGDHSYEGLKNDWESWKDLITVGGIVALHDSRSTPDRNIDEAGSKIFTQSVIVKDDAFSVVETVDSLTILRRVR